MLFDYEIFIIDLQKKSDRSYCSIIDYNRNSEAVSALQDFVIDIMDITEQLVKLYFIFNI